MQGICNVYFIRCAWYSDVQANTVLDEKGKCCCVYFKQRGKWQEQRRDFYITGFFYSG